MHRWLYCWGNAIVLIGMGALTHNILANDVFQLQLRRNPTESKSAEWKAEQTAVIVCDVWDYHHCLNAFNRLGEMVPRMNEVLVEARKRGAIIIHAPSDCMPYYETHAARKRALAVTKSEFPTDIASWCSSSPNEEVNSSVTYPVDQSDGGEDDDPKQHRAWAEKLEAMGRNPGMPWKAQSPGIQIDADRDFISDKGDEVWNILRNRGIQHVIMVGVHTNMCVLGRPFGLRQMVKQKMDVVLVRDMTDCMYNPQRWPYVDHFTGNDLVIDYIERLICPTITSDQILGGKPFRFKNDNRPQTSKVPTISSATKEWRIHTFPTDGKAIFGNDMNAESFWMRCSLRFPNGSLQSPATLQVLGPVRLAWLNGKPLQVMSSAIGAGTKFQIDLKSTFGNDDANLLVVEMASPSIREENIAAPELVTSSGTKKLAGKWETRVGTDQSFNNIPLPAKFGMSPEVFYTLP